MIEIRPIKREKWHGKKGKENFARPHTIQALVDPSTKLYKIDMTSEQLKALSDTVKQDVDLLYNPEEPHHFWDSKMAQVKLENKTMFLDPSKSIYDKVKVKIVKASRFVANSQTEYDKGLWPDATHVIYDEGEEIAIKARDIEIKKKAVLACNELNKEQKVQLIMVLLNKNVKGKSDNFVEVYIDELIEAKPKEVISHLAQDKDKIEVHALVLECLSKSILTKNGHKIEYMGSFIGVDVIEVVDYLLLEEHNQLRVKLSIAVEES